MIKYLHDNEYQVAILHSGGPALFMRTGMKMILRMTVKPVMYIGVRESPSPLRTPMNQPLTTRKINPDTNQERKT